MLVRAFKETSNEKTDFMALVYAGSFFLRSNWSSGTLLLIDSATSVASRIGSLINDAAIVERILLHLVKHQTASGGMNGV